MLPFFRKIRYRLAEDYQFLKYSRYAIGEIILVVIGILIALQINTWNEANKSKKMTLVYMDRLIEDLESDTLMLSEHIDAAIRKNQYCKQIKNIFDNEAVISDTNAFVIHLHGVGRLLNPSVSTNTFDDLKSTGNLKLVKEVEITNSIRNYYNLSPDWWFKAHSGLSGPKYFTCNSRRTRIDHERKCRLIIG